ncbi:MAG TPA: MotA/TolQ/ExbB proton channel family protein [Devosia sp.]|nr:MotA/TolQ/ExbB proton channel family protein [Devosia sp.]
MTTNVPAFLAPASESRDFLPLLKWLLVMVLTAFGFLVLWYFGLVQTMIALDRTRVSIVILAVFIATSLHCLYQTVVVSRELVAARRVREAVVSAGSNTLTVQNGRIVTADGTALETGVVTSHMLNLLAKARTFSGGHFDQTLLLRSLADQLKSREKLGWFISESLLRLALLGTAIGFILMLVPLAELNAFDVDTMRQTLAGMSDGMGIALTITVAGIATALLLKFEYYLLDEAIADLFREVTEVTEVHVIPTFENRSDVPRAESV